MRKSSFNLLENATLFRPSISPAKIVVPDFVSSAIVANSYADLLRSKTLYDKILSAPNSNCVGGGGSVTHFR